MTIGMAFNEIQKKLNQELNNATFRTQNDHIGHTQSFWKKRNSRVEFAKTVSISSVMQVLDTFRLSTKAYWSKQQRFLVKEHNICTNFHPSFPGILLLNAISNSTLLYSGIFATMRQSIPHLAFHLRGKGEIEGTITSRTQRIVKLYGGQPM